MAITAVSVAVTSGAALGTSPPTATVAGSDRQGVIRLGSGTTPTTGTLCTLTLGGSYTGIDSIFTSGTVVIVRPLNAATAALFPDVSAIANGRTITVQCTAAPAASQAVGTYLLGYMVAASG